MEGDEPAAVFPKDRRQSPSTGADKSIATLSVHTAGPQDGEPGEEPGPEYSHNPLINSDDPRVIAHMQKAVGRAVDPWAKAVAIQAWVSKNLLDKNFGDRLRSRGGGRQKSERRLQRA